MSSFVTPIRIGDEEYFGAITHHTKFHSDDVFSTALLHLLYNVEHNMIALPMDTVRKSDAGDFVLNVYRLPIDTVENIKTGLLFPHKYVIYDIGDTKYDHHKSPREVRPNGIPYAAFGKLWRDIYPMLGFDDVHGHIFDRDFVQMIDWNDNDGVANPISTTIAIFNSSNIHDEQLQMRQFQAAVQWAYDMLLLQLNDLMKRMHEAERIQSMSNVLHCPNGDALILDEYYQAYIIQDIRPEKAIIYPHARGGWSIQALKTKSEIPFSGTDTQRWLAPEEYRGKHADALAKAGLYRCKFCHASGFLMNFETKEAAINFALAHM